MKRYALALGIVAALLPAQAGAVDRPVTIACAPKGPGASVCGEVIAAGGAHSCVSAGSVVSCWGLGAAAGSPNRDASRMAAQTAMQDAVALAAGFDFTCAVRRDGTAWCWGSDEYGQLGDGGNEFGAHLPHKPEPVRVRGLTRIAKIAAGASHACAIDRAGSLWCWGRNAEGQLARAARFAYSSPVRVPGRFTSVAGGERHTCASTWSGDVMCWGANNLGQLGNGTRRATIRPTRAGAPSMRFNLVVAGGNHTCALRFGEAWCWGLDSCGQTGSGRQSDICPYDYSKVVQRPARVPHLGRMISLAGGPNANHTCGLARGWTVWCWGDNSVLQLGSGSPARPGGPVQVMRADGDPGWRGVSAGGQHSCAIDWDYTAWCWGDGYSGQTGYPARVCAGIFPVALCLNNREPREVPCVCTDGVPDERVPALEGN